MGGYAALLVPAILVVVAATDVSHSTYVPHTADVTPTPVISLTTVPHDVTTLSHLIQTTRPENTAGTTHHALSEGSTSLHFIHTTRPETTAETAHHALPGHSEVTTSRATHGETGHSEVTAAWATHGETGHSEVTTSRTQHGDTGHSEITAAQHGDTGHSEVTTSGTQHGDNDSPAKPEIRLGITENGLIVSCFSASKIPDIRYELIQDSKVVQNMTVHTNQPANFTIQTPGEMQLQCLARSLSGMEAFSIVQNVSVDKGNQDPKVQRGVSVHPLDAVVKGNETELTDGEETDANLEVRKNTADSLADVFQAVEHVSILILCICGPTILFILLVVIYVTHLRNRRERKALIKQL